MKAFLRDALRSFAQAVVIIGCALLGTASAYAQGIHFEYGVQSTKYGTQGDGTWYQQGMPHVLNMHSYGFTAGLTGTLYARDSWGIDWHVDYVNLGRISSSCSCTPIDANYDTHMHQIVANPTPVANAQFNGTGGAQGIALTIEPWVRYSGWRFGLEAGLFPYRPSWDETISNWQGDLGPARTIHASTPHAIQLGQVVGLSIGRGNSTIALKHYWLPTRFDSSHYPAIWKGATVVEFKVRY